MIHNSTETKHKRYLSEDRSPQLPVPSLRSLSPGSGYGGWSPFARTLFRSILMVFMVLDITAYAQAITSPFAGGDGSLSDPYQISTPEQLNEVRNYLDKNFVLINDIDLITYLSTSGTGYNSGKG